MDQEFKRLAIRSVHPETVERLDDLHQTTRLPRSLLIEEAVDLLADHYITEESDDE